MPFKSQQYPKIAKRWESETTKKKLPKKKGRK